MQCLFQVLDLLDGRPKRSCLLRVLDIDFLVYSKSTSFQHSSPLIVLQEGVDVVHQGSVVLQHFRDRSQGCCRRCLPCTAHACDDCVCSLHSFRCIAPGSRGGHDEPNESGVGRMMALAILELVWLESIIATFWCHMLMPFQPSNDLAWHSLAWHNAIGKVQRT